MVFAALFPYQSQEGYADTIEENPSSSITNLAADSSVDAARSGLAPDLPVLVQPEHNAENVTSPPTLEVAVSDPEGDPLEVSFYGR